MSIGLLLSGELGFKILDHLLIKHKPEFVFTNKTSETIIELCEKNKIPVFIGNPRKNKTEIIDFLKDKPVNLIFSINYLFIVGNEILKHPESYAINFHGSLLPKYRGRTPHVWAIINGEKETGVTAHLMDDDCDTGLILLQKRVPIAEHNTGANILETFNTIYPQMVDEIILKIENKSLKFVEQDNSKATYFGKRTPEDGEINWEWQIERIRNWVRALAEPYPGAFSYYKGKKLIIDEVVKSDLGYSYVIPNGTIIKNGKVPFVKTPNGVLKLTKIRNSDDIRFENNTKLDMSYEN